LQALFRWLDLNEGPRCLLATCSIGKHDPSTLSLIDWDELRTFKTQKRTNEHLSARWLLQKALAQWGGIDCNQISVDRTEQRAPYLKAIQGLWLHLKLPNVSISHSENLACVALVECGWTVGVDAEPLERELRTAMYDMMAKGEELLRLRAGQVDALWTWTVKEAVQKATRMGMHLNPRDIVVRADNKENKISIGNSIFQLENLTNDGYCITLAWGPDENPIRSLEDDVLDATREAMSLNDAWTVGCASVRKNA
tara:strand:+ start:1106 stop:1867 length:762 start_codon:yes stop_codon:yes gene_type:complete